MEKGAGQYQPYRSDYVYGRANRGLKYALDKIIALLLLVFLSPLLVFVALLIFLEGIVSPGARGTVIIGDPRISEGRSFSM